MTMPEILEEFPRFLSKSPTAFHACREISNRLAERDFTPLLEGEKWELEPGKGYFLTRGGSLLAAFRLPRKKPSSAIFLASHLDSPALKLKPEAELRQGEIGEFGTEVYGSPLLHTWLDRDLILAGKVCALHASGQIQSHLISLDEAPLIIPGLALHLDRSVTEKGILVHKQDHLKAIFSLKGKEHSLEKRLRKHLGFEKLLSFDLFLVPSEKPSFLGLEGELLAAYRLDNLSSAYAALYALLHAKGRAEGLQIALFWDHEEIGSVSQTGGDSVFANELLERICLSLRMGREDFYCLKSQSLCLSIDVAHGFHPNFTDKYDSQNAPFLGKGVVLKFNANQKYATSSGGSAPLVALAKKQRLPLQVFASRSDIPSGSTVGPFMAAQLGIPTVDLGIACWAMHSSRETCAAEDELALCAFLKAALEESLSVAEE